MRNNQIRMKQIRMKRNNKIIKDNLRTRYLKYLYPKLYKISNKKIQNKFTKNSKKNIKKVFMDNYKLLMNNAKKIHIKINNSKKIQNSNSKEEVLNRYEPNSYIV